MFDHEENCRVCLEYAQGTPYHTALVFQAYSDLRYRLYSAGLTDWPEAAQAIMEQAIKTDLAGGPYWHSMLWVLTMGVLSGK